MSRNFFSVFLPGMFNALIFFNTTLLAMEAHQSEGGSTSQAIENLNESNIVFADKILDQYLIGLNFGCRVIYAISDEAKINDQDTKNIILINTEIDAFQQDRTERFFSTQAEDERFLLEVKIAPNYFASTNSGDTLLYHVQLILTDKLSDVQYFNKNQLNLINTIGNRTKDYFILSVGGLEINFKDDPITYSNVGIICQVYDPNKEN